MQGSTLEGSGRAAAAAVEEEKEEEEEVEVVVVVVVVEICWLHGIENSIGARVHLRKCGVFIRTL